MNVIDVTLTIYNKCIGYIFIIRNTSIYEKYIVKFVISPYISNNSII